MGALRGCSGSVLEEGGAVGLVCLFSLNPESWIVKSLGSSVESVSEL